MLKAIDSFLLNRAQKFCDAFHRLTGLTKFWIEKWSAIVFTLSLELAFVLRGRTPDVWVLIPALAIWGIIVVRSAEKEEREFLSHGKLRYSSVKTPLFRIVAFTLVVMPHGVIGLLNDSTTSLMTALSYALWIYVSACVPRPPGKSKVREWYESALTWLGDRLRDTPVPAGA